MKSSFKKKKINYNRRNNKRLENIKSIKLIDETKLNEKSKKNSYLKLLIEPCKFLDPIFSYRLNADLIILDKARYNINNDLKGIFSSLCEYKRILSVFFNKKLNIFSITFENYDNSFGSSDLLISRLESLNDQDALNLSHSINNFLKNYERMNLFCKFCNNQPKDKERYKEFIKKKQEKIKKYNMEKKIFNVVDFVFDNDLKKIQINKISLSTELVETIFKSHEEAYFYLGKNLPDYLTVDVNHFYENYNNMLKILYDQNNSDQNLHMYLITKNFEKIYVTVKLEKDIYLEDNFIESYFMNIVLNFKKNIKSIENYVLNFNEDNVSYILREFFNFLDYEPKFRCF